MSAWLDIDGGPDGYVTSFTQGKNPAAAGALILPRLSEISALRRTISIPGLAAASAASFTATLDNADGAITRHYAAAPPLRRRAELFVGGTQMLAGVVTGLGLAGAARLDVTAGLDRPLSDHVPLRTSAAWGGWRDIVALPWGYGQVTITPIQYGSEQRVFFLLDHPIAGVDSVKRDDVETSAWHFWNGTDSAGHACAFIELATPLAAGERLAVTLRGRLHPVTGRLLASAAEILWDVLANLAGLDVAWEALDDYRAETAGLTLGGLIDDNAVTIRATLDALLQSTGSAWSAAMPGIAHLWPAAADDAAPAMLVTPLAVTDVSASCRHDDIYTVLRVLYDYDHAAGRARRAVQIEAPEAIRNYGRLELEWDAGWLRSPRHAEALGQRLLRAIARPRWQIGWQQSAPAAPGGWVEIDHPQLPVSGRHRLIEAEVDFSGAQITCALTVPAGEPPAVVTGQLSSAFDPLIQAGITVEIAGSEIIFTARGDDGQPLPGAKITLDGGVSRIADNAGRVSFPVQRGRHVLLVEAQGYPPSESVITL